MRGIIIIVIIQICDMFYTTSVFVLSTITKYTYISILMAQKTYFMLNKYYINKCNITNINN